MKGFAVMRNILFIAGIILFVSCMSEPLAVQNEVVYSEMPVWFLKNSNTDSGISFSAFSPRMSDREAEKENCLDLIARQVSMYYSVQGEFNVLEEKNSSGSRQVKQENVVIDENILESIKENLTIVEELESSKGTYIKAAIQGSKSAPSYKTSYQDNMPVWINEPPKIKGYIVSIGTARRHRMLNASLYAADINALEQMLKQKNVNIRAGKKEATTEYLTKTKEVNIEKTSGSVNGFYVLERFIAEDGNYYYSLAVSPE